MGETVKDGLTVEARSQRILDDIRALDAEFETIAATSTLRAGGTVPFKVAMERAKPYSKGLQAAVDLLVDRGWVEDICRVRGMGRGEPERDEGHD